MAFSENRLARHRRARAPPPRGHDAHAVSVRAAASARRVYCASMLPCVGAGFARSCAWACWS
eukprot:scaffold64115_cov65-Phaeocystis_antarctica.AAC.5